jgi:hypothetical protein
MIQIVSLRMDAIKQNRVCEVADGSLAGIIHEDRREGSPHLVYWGLVARKAIASPAGPDRSGLRR